MEWEQALTQGSVAPHNRCSLIFIGETKEGQPFCYEDSFRIEKADLQELTLSMEYPSIHPLEKLHHVHFVEFSFKEQGMLYYALIDLLQLEAKRNVCTLKLTAPKALSMKQHRRYSRVCPPTRTPVTCRIVGVRGPTTHRGIVFSGQMLDVSAGGISFLSSTRILCPLFLEISFLLPGVEHKITVYGEVIRVELFGSDAYRVAVRFDHPPESVVKGIDEFCQTFHEKQEKP